MWEGSEKFRIYSSNGSTISLVKDETNQQQKVYDSLKPKWVFTTCLSAVSLGYSLIHAGDWDRLCVCRKSHKLNDMAVFGLTSNSVIERFRKN